MLTHITTVQSFSSCFMCCAQSQFLPRHRPTLTTVFTHSENHLVSFPEVSTPIRTLTHRVTTKSLFRKALLIKLPASLRYDVTTIQLGTVPRDLVLSSDFQGTRQHLLTSGHYSRKQTHTTQFFHYSPVNRI